VRKRLLAASVVATVLALGGLATASDGHRPRNHFETTLRGFEENPSLSTTGRGHAEIRIDTQKQEIAYELSYDRLEGVGTTPFVTNGVVTQAHIHVSARAVNGGVAVFFCGPAPNQPCPTPSGAVKGIWTAADIVGPAAQGINPGEETAFNELVRAIRAGFAYANVHTTRWPGGEIRGQLEQADDHHRN
jgi:hypothetical protein